MVNLAAQNKDQVDDIVLEQLMQQLSVEERVLLTLSYSAVMTHGEIKDVLQIPLGTVKSQIKRTGDKLTFMLSESLKGSEEAVA